MTKLQAQPPSMEKPTIRDDHHLWKAEDLPNVTRGHGCGESIDISSSKGEKISNVDLEGHAGKRAGSQHMGAEG